MNEKYFRDLLKVAQDFNASSKNFYEQITTAVDRIVEDVVFSGTKESESETGKPSGPFMDELPNHCEVFTTSSGGRFVFDTLLSRIYRERDFPDGIRYGLEMILYRWPDRKRYQLGDLVDVYAKSAVSAVPAWDWRHEGRIFIDENDHGILTYCPGHRCISTNIESEVRPHEEGTK